jgi:hypothetical protein
MHQEAAYPKYQCSSEEGKSLLQTAIIISETDNYKNGYRTPDHNSRDSVQFDWMDDQATNNDKGRLYTRKK